MNSRRLVILESPYAGDVAANLDYARRCMRDSLQRGESPIASHALYTQPGVLDDANQAERRLGIAAGLAWLPRVDASVVYTDHGISGGMQQGIAAAQLAGVPVEYRQIGVAAAPAAPAAPTAPAAPAMAARELRERWDLALSALRSLGSYKASPPVLSQLEAAVRSLVNAGRK